MKRSRRVALAALCVLALAAGAATLNDTTAPRGSGTPGQSNGSSFDPFPQPDQGNETDDDIRANPQLFSVSLCIEFLTTSTFYALASVGFLLLGAILYRKGGVLLAIAGIGVLVTPGFLVWAILTTCARPDFSGRTTDPLNRSGGSGGLFGGDSGGVVPATGSPDVSHAILLATAIVIVLIALFMLKATGDDREAEEHSEEAEEIPPESLAGIAGVAGEAADRIESGDVDTENEVYRAWREMTGFLDVPNPRTATPAEFREAARDAGMTRSEVDVLTDLFREVRYGGESPTADREAAAVDALRAIEDAYGERGGDGA